MNITVNRLGRPVAFWIGVAVITVGVGLALYEAEILRARAEPYSFTPTLVVALLLDLLGTCLAAWSVLPRGLLAHRRKHLGRSLGDESISTSIGLEAMGTEPSSIPPSSILPVALNENEVGALDDMDDSPLTPRHWFMILRMYAGLVIDTMKPATLGFMLPGLRAEYGLSPTVVALFPLAAIIGLTMGSVLFGMLGDIVGRRTSFVFTALMFATTAPCGLMPGYGWHLITCFAMGLAAGGELPLIYTMLAETMPRRHRGWTSVAIGGFGGLSGYLVASLLAAWLEPRFSWRALWLPNLPTALFMLGLLRWVHESPRYLLQLGLIDEAKRAVASMGVKVQSLALATTESPGKVSDLWNGPLRSITTVLCSFGFAWGLCNWGFITWLPEMLRGAGFEATLSSELLSRSALYALPGTIIVAGAFGFWSSRWTAAISALVTALVLVTFWVVAPSIHGRVDLAVMLTTALLFASSSMTGVLAPYSVELYPTALRGLGSGVVTASSKSGGIVGPMLVGVLLTFNAGVGLPALVIAVPVALAGVAIGLRGPETRGRSLEALANLHEERSP